MSTNVDMARGKTHDELEEANNEGENYSVFVGRCEPIPSPVQAIILVGQLCRRIKMHLAANPQWYLVQDGYIIVQNITEGHIVVHIEGDYMNMGVLSHKCFPEKEAARFCIEWFHVTGLKQIHYQPERLCAVTS